MSLHRPSGNVVNRVNNNKYHPSTDAPQELDKGWYTLDDIPQLNGTSTSLSYKPHPQESSMMEEANKGGANDKHCPSTEAPRELAKSSFAIPSSQVTDLSTGVGLPAGKSQKHLAQLGNDPIDDESKAVYSSKVGPAKEVSVTPADHEEDTNKESPNDVAKPSSAAVSVGKAQLKNNDKRLPLDEAPPQEPAKKKARTSFAIPSSQVTDLSTDVELQPPPMKEKKFDDVAGAALTTLLGRQEFVGVLAQIDPERRKICEELASRHLCSFCSCHINTRPNTYTPIPSDVKAC